MKKMNNSKIELFPSAVIVYNFTAELEAKLSQSLSAHPGEPVLFLSTVYNPEVFSQAENHNRTFVFSRKFINPAEVFPEYPAQWLSEGDFIPQLPGNLRVTATDRGFTVRTIPPDPPHISAFI